MSLNLIGVIRLSTDEQAREGRAGLDRQRHDIATIQSQTGARIIRTIEVIESGSLVRDDLQFQQMFRDVADPSVDGIALSALDRLVRPSNFTDFSVLDNFRGKKIYTPNGAPIDTSTQGGFLEATLRAMFAGMEKQEIKRRTMGGKARNRDKGMCVVGQQCLARGVLYDRAARKYFYDLDPKRDVPRPKRSRPGDALLVRRAFHLLVVEDLSFEAIAQTLGAGWTGNGVRTSVGNPIWIGYQRYLYEGTGVLRKSKKTHRNYSVMTKRKDPPMQRVIEEPLIARELWDRAQEIVKRRSQEFGKRKNPPRFLLVGLLECAVCGKPWYSRSRGLRGKQANHSTDYYYCSSGHHTRKQRITDTRSAVPCGAKSIQRPGLDAAVGDIITGNLLDPEFLQSVIQLQRGATPVADNEREREQGLAELKAEKDRLLKAYLKKRISEEDFDREAKDIDSNILALHTLYPKPTVYPWNDGLELAQILIKAFRVFKRLRVEDRILLLRRAVRRITINAQMICSITFQGGFLGGVASECANLTPNSTIRCEFSATPDLTIYFPQPIAIKRLDGRKRAA